MIIKTNSKELNEIGRVIREGCQSFLNVNDPTYRAYFVPHGLDGLFITFDKESNDLAVIAENETADALDFVQGFKDLDECWSYARIVAKEAGLSEDDIDADIFEDSQLYVLVSIIINHRAAYEVYGQHYTDDGMGVRLFGEFDSLEQAREKAEFVASSCDCPLVEMLGDSRPKMRDVVEELG